MSIDLCGVVDSQTSDSNLHKNHIFHSIIGCANRQLYRTQRQIDLKRVLSSISRVFYAKNKIYRNENKWAQNGEIDFARHMPFVINCRVCQFRCSVN